MEIHPDLPPLRVDDSGQVRVGKTRLIFKLVIEAYLDGATAEEIAEKIYPTTALADIYGAIAYYLRHKDDVTEYMHKWDEAGEKLRREIEAKQSPNSELKARLLARKAELEMKGARSAEHAPLA